MFPTEAFNYAHQQAFNSLTSSMLEGDTLHGNVSTTGGDQVNEISNQHALQQQQQQQQQEEAHESEEELPWEEQMALALEPTPLRWDKAAQLFYWNRGEGADFNNLLSSHSMKHNMPG